MKKQVGDIRHKTLDAIKFITKAYGDKFSNETLNFVRHYCDVDEYEMAFEGLMIELIKNNIRLDSNFKNALIEIGLDLNLDKEPNFDSFFWENFSSFIAK